MSDDKQPKEKKKTYGGMAVVEGVMMRSPNHYSVACRAPNGAIVVKTEHIEKTWIGRQKWLMKPFLRGTFALLDTMGLGMRAMGFASEVQLDQKFQPQDDETVHPEKHQDEPPGKMQRIYEKNQPFWDKVILGLTLVVSLALGFFLFQATPQVLAEYMVRFFSGGGGFSETNEHLTTTNYVAEVIKLAFFIAYISLIRLYPAIMDVFRYHGAEHQAINAMEEEVELTPENCLRQTRLHPRCGTNFAILVFLVGFLLFPFIPRDLVVSADSAGWLIAPTRLPVELALLPVVAGISYEIIRIAGKFKNEAWVNFLLWPGLKTQLITTAVPEARHAEVAISSLEAAVLAEETGELTNSEDYTPTALRSGEKPDAPDQDVEPGAEEARLANEL